ncbi:hypothetical protein CERSUDRAFT_83213 [Gelatoporia subvermispora B]|uniref:Uncharacterized protein n=1 Tax=Ceriporiopsis subvermispora (strain B) TaxID=914234 RepID=M2RF96_CERS8|nr:hypothetical protein CERSUDRAFT_83213 [Gelatoporia subvermispora B]
MSLARAASRSVLPRNAPVQLIQRRWVGDHLEHSSSSPNLHEPHVDARHFLQADEHTTYTTEGFTSRTWLYFVAFSAAAVGWYKFAPYADEDSSIKRWIAQYKSSGSFWEDEGVRRLRESFQFAEETKSFREAKAEPVFRYRYTQRFEQFSPFMQPVGTDVNFSDLVVKS